MAPAPTLAPPRKAPREAAPGPAPAASRVAAVLEEYGGVTRRRLFQYLPRSEPRKYLYDLLPDYPKRGGRGFRPSLCIAAARAFGAPMEAALQTAVSIELMHNAMLIHDDIEDESEQRRGQPTLHRQEGIPLAINVGDALSLLALRPLLDNLRTLSPATAMRILRETERMALESAEGQALELGWRRDNPVDISEEDYLLMVLKKTCWLGMIHPLRMGALIARQRAVALDGFIRFGFFLGAAFQIQDDLLNLEGDAQSYGKELAGDILEGKRTLMLIRLFRRADPAERERLHAFLGRPRGERGEAEVRWVRERMDHYGCIGYAREFAHGLVGAAQRECDRLFARLPAGRDRQFIRALPAWVIERT